MDKYGNEQAEPGDIDFEDDLENDLDLGLDEVREDDGSVPDPLFNAGWASKYDRDWDDDGSR